MSMIDSLVKKIEIKQSVFDEAKVHFSESMLIELVQIIGLYTGVAMMVALAQPELDSY
jgi:alkylhydroperoxidase family enzyme